MPQKNQQNVTLIFRLSVGKGVQAGKLLTENIIFGEKILEIEQALKWYTTITYYNNADPWKTGLKWCCITFDKPCTIALKINKEHMHVKKSYMLKCNLKCVESVE